uniref:Uncharacterized protein n=1 Tax=Kalanchoe fedtschenkoi TaxID=63787 RepID=A0A7N0ZUJ1_KALFE
MCPLRLILLFLSATLAGFFVLRNLKAQPDADAGDVADQSSVDSPATRSPSSSSKVFSAVGSAFWTGVDMASGRYLWRHMTASSHKRLD